MATTTGILRVSIPASAMLMSLGISSGFALDWKSGTSWTTTDSRTGMEEMCVLFDVGNTHLLSMEKGYRSLALEDMSAMDIMDCTRGLKLARKHHTVRHFTPKDLEGANK